MIAKPLACAAVLSMSVLAASPAMAQQSGPAFPPWGLSLDYLDKTVKPGDDFFLYANGAWVKKNVIPADRSYSGVNLELNKQNEARLKAIMEGLKGRPGVKLSAEQRKLRDFYGAYTDQPGIEKRGLAPARKDLAAIAALSTLTEVARAMGSIALQLDGPFGLYVGVDDKHPNSYSVNIYQSGLGLPDRDYYLLDNKGIADTRDAYRKYLAKMLQLAGVGDAAPRAAAVYALENQLAVASWPAADRRDAVKTYNPLAIDALRKLAPQFPWDAFFSSAGIPLKGPKGSRNVIVAEKSAFPKLAQVFASTPVAVWRDYLTVRYMHTFAQFLPKAVDDADFAFYGTVLSGNTKQLDRATRGVQLLDSAMGEALGRLYVARYFPPEAKAKAQDLVENLLKAYEADIKTLSWMTPATRAKALDKLHKFTPKIGYPDKWRDYTALSISGDLVGDAKAATQFEWNRRVVRLDRPVDKAEWGMTPPTNNAYYNPTFNEVVFPAGILQPPFFDAKADDAVNYGEIGATIGHEISHGFDDQGSKYDGDGVLENWWTQTDRKNFDARTSALAKQYDQYEPLPGIHINGKLTLGENIADLAGLVIAYKAYHLSLKGKPAPVLNGWTGDQRFYLAYSQSWREMRRPGRLRAQLLSNPHSPADYRVNGVVRNDDGWYAAFPGIKAGDKYYLAPRDRVRLW